MTDRDGETGLIGQLLQFPFPQAHPRAVAASSVRADEQAFRLRILLLPHLVPPTSDALHGKGGRLMVDAHVDPAGIASQVVHPIRRRSPQALHGEVVNPHVLRFSLRVPFSPRVLKIAHQFLLFRVHRHRRFTCGKARGGLRIEVFELPIAIGVLAALARLAQSLQAVAQLVQQLAHQLMRDLMSQVLQFLGQLAHALARPPQWRLRVSPRHRLHQSFQVLAQAGVLAHVALAPASNPSDPSLSRSLPLPQFLHPVHDDLPRQPRRSRHHGNPSPAQCHGFVGREEPPCPFIQFSRESLVSLLDLFFFFHVESLQQILSLYKYYSLTTPKRAKDFLGRTITFDFPENYEQKLWDEFHQEDIQLLESNLAKKTQINKDLHASLVTL